MTTSKIKLDSATLKYIFSITDPVSEDELEFRLKSNNYKINKERVISRPPLQAVILNFARKNDINIIYEKDKIPTYLGVRSKKICSVIDEFEMLTGVLRDINTSILDQSNLIESVITARVFLDKKKHNDYAKNLAKDDMDRFNKKFNNTFVLDNFRVISQTEDDSSDQYIIHIAPYYQDTRYTFIQATLQTQDLETALEYLHKYEKYLNSVIEVIKNE